MSSTDHESVREELSPADPKDNDDDHAEEEGADGDVVDDDDDRASVVADKPEVVPSGVTSSAARTCRKQTRSMATTKRPDVLELRRHRSDMRIATILQLFIPAVVLVLRNDND